VPVINSGEQVMKSVMAKVEHDQNEGEQFLATAGVNVQLNLSAFIFIQTSFYSTDGRPVPNGVKYSQPPVSVLSRRVSVMKDFRVVVRGIHSHNAKE
jgi:hypothetical protein